MAVTADQLKRVISRYHERLTRHREALNRLNVYPVPDGDTGTNMTLTVQAVVEEVREAEGMEAVAAAMAHGSLMGARGNSGVILSQILRGLADTFRDADEIGTLQLVEALDRAAEAAYRAVLRPVEGTILTVLRSAADAAAETGTTAGGDLGALLRSTFERAEATLESTPDQLPVLKEAGVVDAGGAGFLLLIVAFLEEVTGVEVVVPPRIFAADTEHILEHASRDGEIEDLRYEVMFFLETDERAIDRFRESWGGLGESIVVVGGEGIYNCHIHTDDIGPAIEAAVEVGRPFRIAVTDLQAAPDGSREEPYVPRPGFGEAAVGVVPVVAGAGLVSMFRDLGAQGVVTGGQTMNPSTQDLLAVVDSVPAETVILLPNNKNIVPVARQVGTLTVKEVLVVPTTSVPQGLAAMVSYLPRDTDAGALVEAMEAAAGDVRTGELTRATREAATPAGPVARGTWLGLVDGVIRLAAEDAEAALTGLLDVLVEDGSELVTVLTGREADPEVTGAALSWLSERRPGVLVEVADGGQPLYPYLISVE